MLRWTLDYPTHQTPVVIPVDLMIATGLAMGGGGGGGSIELG